MATRHTIALLAVLALGCTKVAVCRPGTVLLAFALPATTSLPAQLEVTVVIDGVKKISMATTSAREGTIEVRFPAGYPRGLRREQMSIPARLMGIADVFEALTASDRPYKSAKTLSESMQILGRMKVDQHIDADLFDVFVRERVYLSYAQQFLDPRQIDYIDWHRIPGVSVELADELSAGEQAPQ